MLNSVSRKIMAAAAGTFALGIALTVLSGFLVYDAQLQRREDRANIRFTELVAEQAAPGIHIDRRESVGNLVREYTAAAGGDLVAFATYNDGGERLTLFTRADAERRFPERIDVSGIESARRDMANGGGLLVPARLSDGSIAGYVASRWQSDSLQAIRREALLYSVAAALVSWLLAGALLWWLLNRNVTRPVTALTGLVWRLGQEDDRSRAVRDPELARIVETERTRGDEIGDMAHALELLRDSELERERAERALEAANREMDDILATVDEGLFLVAYEDDDFRIGQQHSAALTDLLGAERLAGRPIVEVLGPCIDESTRNDLQRFLRLLFRPRFDEETLRQLNPVSDITIETGQGARHLALRFQRVFANDDITKVLGVVMDRTEEVRLSRQLEESERRSRSQMALLTRILETDPGLLHDFVTTARREMAEIDESLAGSGGSDPGSLQAAFRAAHAIKGNAALLDLDFVAEQAHDLEDILGDALAQSPPRADIDQAVERLRSELRLLDDLIAKLTRFRETFAQGASDATQATVKAIESRVRKSAAEAGKSVSLDAQGFEVGDLPDAERLLVKDAVIQLVRNAVHHGIEDPEERRQMNKTPEGRIRLASTRANGHLHVTVEDDGRGLSHEALRRRAGEVGHDTGDVAAWSDAAVADLVFSSGLSTADSVSRAAGRGVGLDLVRRRIRDAGGEISVATEPGARTRFDIDLPLS
jgi:signal transduction histidine kinase